MTWVSRRILVPLGVLAFSAFLSACSSGVTGSVGTSGQSDAFVVLDVSQPATITIENRSGQPLVDVNLTIKSGMLGFSGRVSRLEAKETRQIRHSDFTSRDGTSFNLRVARPKEIAVTAKGLDGKEFTTTLPW